MHENSPLPADARPSSFPWHLAVVFLLLAAGVIALAGWIFEQERR